MENIKGFKDYSINSAGNVYSTKRGKTILLKPGVTSVGYLSVSLCENNNPKTFLIHRLIADTFIPNPLGYRCINHKDGNKLNNAIENLEWCNHKQNNEHARNTGLNKLSGSDNYASKLVLNLQTGIFYDTVTEAANSRGIAIAYLSRMLNGKQNNNTPLCFA